jgi:hypothetical protein
VKPAPLAISIETSLACDRVPWRGRRQGPAPLAEAGREAGTARLGQAAVAYSAWVLAPVM